MAARVVPFPGMQVTVMHLGTFETVLVETIADDGRTLVAGGRRFTLRRLTGHYVLEGEPVYGTRLSLAPELPEAPG